MFFKFLRFLPVSLLVFFIAFPNALAEDSVKKEEKSPLSWSKRTVRKHPSLKIKSAVKNFNSNSSKKWKIRYNPLTGAPESIMEGRFKKRYPGRNPKERARAFLKDNAEMLNINTANLKEDKNNSFFGLNHVRYQQYYKGLPVEFSYTKVHIEEDGTVAGYQSSYNSDLDIDIVPSISAAQALQTASADAGTTIKISSHTLVIYPDNVNDNAYLAWKIRGRSYDNQHIWVYYVDAKNGKVLFHYDDMRRITDADCNTKTVCFDSCITAKAEGEVYEISPIPSDQYTQMAAYLWQTANTKSERPFSDQYIWIKDYQTRMVTDVYGNAKSTNAKTYANNTWVSSTCATGKLFTALKGPYFTVTNFRDKSAHWDNGAGQLLTGALERIISRRPYANNEDITWEGNLDYNPGLQSNSSYTFAKQYPLFNAPFRVGSMDENGIVQDADEVFLLNNEGIREGSYIGERDNPFLGSSVENPKFFVKLHSDSSGIDRGFSISQSKYIVLTNLPVKTSTVPHGNEINWSTTSMKNHSTGLALIDTAPFNAAGQTYGDNGTFAMDEANVFYHLNKMRRYFEQFNLIGYIDPVSVCNSEECKRKPIDLDKHLDVMVHANGAVDKMGLTESKHGMMNAFFDLDLNNIMIGDGMYDGKNASYAYRSFALDGTIIRHEYTHFVVHQIYNIINFGEFGAISEALSDYFALASLWQEGDRGDSKNSVINALKENLTKVGNFVMYQPRDLSLGICPPESPCASRKKLPGSWKGELYNDSEILSQALYRLRKESPLGSTGHYMTEGYWGSVPVADLVLFASLFYFPDSFLNLYESMKDVCTRLNNKWPGSCLPDRIYTVFDNHNLISGGSTSDYDDYEAAAGGLCQNNNGPECAPDITNNRELNATVYPEGDVDYYTFTANAGTVNVELDLPIANNYMYHAFMLTLLDSERTILAQSVPFSSGSYETCVGNEECRSVEPKTVLKYNLPKSGRYYIMVSAPESWYDELGANGISPENSTDPYTLRTSFVEQGHVTAKVNRSESSFDNDVILFSAPVVVSAARTNNMILESTRTFSMEDPTVGGETYFTRVQLWDVLGNKLDQANTAYPDTLNRLLDIYREPTMDASGVINGEVKIQSGFSKRYPAVASVVLEVIGTNHMGSEISLGKSEPVNLTAQSARFETYNNALIKGEGETLIRFAVSGQGRLTIKAYTQSGKLVKVIADRPVEAGEQGNEKWDGTNEKGAKVASGIYFVKAEGPGLNKIEKIAVVR